MVIELERTNIIYLTHTKLSKKGQPGKPQKTRFHQLLGQLIGKPNKDEQSLEVETCVELAMAVGSMLNSRISGAAVGS